MQTYITFFDRMDPQQLFWLRLIGGAALAVAAVFGTRLFRRATGAMLRCLEPHVPHWLHLLAQGFHEPLVLLMRAVLAYCAVLVLPIPFIETKTLWLYLTPFVRAATVLLMAWGFWRAAPLCRLLLQSSEEHLDLKTNRTMAHFFENIYRFIVAVFAVLIVLDMFGVPVVSLVAGAGIAGLAISLAAQSTLSNLIAGVTLVLEQPFRIGDYILLGGFDGTVEDISFRSTRLRTPDNIVISVENSKVCAEYIQNATLRSSRLWAFTLCLTYSTPRTNIEAFCQDLRNHFETDPQLLPDRVSVTVDELADSGVNILIRIYTATADYYRYLRTKDRINREILILLEHHGCTLAYPSTSVYLEPKA